MFFSKKCATNATTVLIHSILKIAHIDLLNEQVLTTAKQQQARRYIFGLLESLKREIILPVVLNNRRKFSHHTSSSSNTMISAIRFGSNMRISSTRIALICYLSERRKSFMVTYFLSSKMLKKSTCNFLKMILVSFCFILWPLFNVHVQHLKCNNNE